MNQSKLTAIQKVQQHYQTRLSSQLHKYHVEEWNIDVYYRNITSLKQESQVVELASSGKTVEALIQTVINKALDEDGKPMFAPADKAALLNECDPNVIINLSKILSSAELPSIGEVEKN